MYGLSQITALTSVLAGFLGGSSYLVYAIISSQAAVLVNLLMNDALVFRGRARATGLVRRFTFFNSIASGDLLLRLPILWGFTTFLSIPAVLSAFDSILLTFAGRVLISTKKNSPKPGTYPFNTTSAFTHRTSATPLFRPTPVFSSSTRNS